jgi:hypothetical protein
VKPPRYIFYKPRVASYRGGILLLQGLWVVFVNAVCVVVYAIHTVLWLLWLLIAYPARMIGNAVGHQRELSAARKLDRARVRMRRYQDGK